MRPLPQWKFPPPSLSYYAAYVPSTSDLFGIFYASKKWASCNNMKHKSFVYLTLLFDWDLSGSMESLHYVVSMYK